MSVNVFPFLMRATTSEDRDQAFSLFMALMPLGAFAGSLVGGLLPGLFGSVLRASLEGPVPYRYALIVAASFQIAELAILLVARAPEAAAEVSEAAAERERAPVAVITLLAVVQLLLLAADASVRTFFNVYLDAGLNQPTARVGTLAAASQLVSAFAPLFVPLLVARWERRYLVATAPLLIALSTLPLALVPHWSAAALGWVAVNALTMMLRAVFTVYVLELVLPRWQAAMSGAVGLTNSLSYAVMALAGGYIAASLGFRALFLIGAGVTAAGALLFWAYFRVPRGELAAEPATEAVEQVG
jgi:MFS family permease